jgi:hypothetical protein
MRFTTFPEVRADRAGLHSQALELWRDALREAA